MKVIFLDFDGVLNSEKYIRECPKYGVVINPAKMGLLKQITDATDAKIVLSTSWREHWDTDRVKCDAIGSEINAIFAQHGLRIFDKTPHARRCREEEVAAWLDEHPEVVNFVVLDDRFLDSALLRGHFVKTSYHCDGLDETDVKRAIEILQS